MDPEQVVPRIEEPGHVVRTTLNDQVEAQLNAAFAAAAAERSRKPA
jgi:hypothetical protein